AVGAREEAIPLSRMRQTIAQHMVASIQTSARAWNLVEVNMENVVRVRTAAKDAFKEREGISLTYMPFVARAVCDALLQYPDVNAELRGDQLIIKRYVNLGIAVALDDGLIVPVVKNADSMNAVGLARAINDVATRARTKKLTPDDVHGGTFTITNPGPFGSIMSVPVINPPQCAILALDAVEKRPVVIDDSIAIRHMVYLSMSWDHRIIDGATAAKFLAQVHFVDRGGSVTFHGPGQLVGYPIVDLGIRPDVVAYVRRLEQVVLGACAEAGVTGLSRNQINSGVWAGDRKVCAIGIRVTRARVTLHGFALNCTTDLGWYDAIVPCGLADHGVTSLSEVAGREVTVEEMAPLVARHFET